MAWSAFLKKGKGIIALAVIAGVALMIAKHTIHTLQQSTPELASEEVTGKSLVPEWKWLDAQSFTNLLDMSFSVLEAYACSNTQIMSRAFHELLAKSVNVAPEQYSKVYGPIFGKLSESFFKSRLDCCDINLKDFTDYIILNRELILLLGEGETKRNYFSDYVFYSQYWYLKRLYEYRLDFEQHERSDLSGVVEKFVNEWIEMIDSSWGIPYRYVHWDFQLNLVLVRNGRMSHAEAVRASRYCVSPLSELMGRPPKWIDEIK